MTRKRNSPVLNTAQRRLKAVQYLNPTLDLGNGIDVETFAALTEELRVKLGAFNAMIDAIDKQREEIDTLEAKIKPKSERMLSAMATIYGKDSDEYAMAGGTKRESKSAPTMNEDELLNLETPSLPNLLLNVTEPKQEDGMKNGRRN